MLAAGSTCGGEHRALRGLVCHVAPFRYVGTGGRLVRRFKLDGDAGAGRCLVRAMAAAWLAAGDAGLPRPSLVPIPLHPRRRRHRGFDQARWLAEQLGQRLDLPVAVDLLQRVAPTLPQGDPRVTNREANVAEAFRVSGRVGGRRLLLVDDVFTSGATARTCAALLRARGAPAVGLLTACKS